MNAKHAPESDTPEPPVQKWNSTQTAMVSYILGLLSAAVVVLIASALAGCAGSAALALSNDVPQEPIPACQINCSPDQSWDQENLKRNDHGCPTAIWIAPDGVPVQC